MRVEGWIAFGTLLGAAREGKVIGHDSDIDLAYLSEKPTPAEMAVELYGVARALRAPRHAGASTSPGQLHHGASSRSLTAARPASTSTPASTSASLLYETATVRAPVPRQRSCR